MPFISANCHILFVFHASSGQLIISVMLRSLDVSDAMKRLLFLHTNGHRTQLDGVRYRPLPALTRKSWRPLQRRMDGCPHTIPAVACQFPAFTNQTASPSTPFHNGLKKKNLKRSVPALSDYSNFWFLKKKSKRSLQALSNYTFFWFLFLCLVFVFGFCFFWLGFKWNFGKEYFLLTFIL